MNSWLLFLAYAKAHPSEVPRLMKERSKYYNALKSSCVCGNPTNNKICGIVGIQSKIKLTNIREKINIESQIKALQDKSNRDAAYILDLEDQLSTFNKKNKSA